MEQEKNFFQTVKNQIGWHNTNKGIRRGSGKTLLHSYGYTFISERLSPKAKLEWKNNSTHP